MKTVGSILLLLVWIPCVARAEAPAGWSTNYASAISQAATNQRPVLIYFTASWCGPCKLMSRLTLTNATIEQTLSTIEHVAVDIDFQRDLAAKYTVEAVPTFVMLSASGDPVRQTTGFQTAGEFLRWLTNGISDADQSLVQQALLQEKLAKVDRLLASSNSDAPRLAAAELFDLCGERDAMSVTLARERLKSLASRDAKAVLEGMNDPRLATRLYVANALRERLGDSFDLDPWSGPTERLSGIQEWRRRLTTRSVTKGP